MAILRPVKAKTSTAIVDGSAEQYIVKAAEEGAADLIVMGARGIKGIKSLIVGSVTKAVALNSSKPVLITRLPVRDDPGMKILFVTDGSEDSLDAGRFLTTVPFSDGSEVTILNVIWSDFSEIPERFVVGVNERMKEIIARSRSSDIEESGRITSRAEMLIAGRFRKIHVLSQIGDPSVEILNTAERLKPDLIAMGCRGLRGMKGRMGSVARNVITHSGCSVLLAQACRG